MGPEQVEGTEVWEEQARAQLRAYSQGEFDNQAEVLIRQ